MGNTTRRDSVPSGLSAPSSPEASEDPSWQDGEYDSIVEDIYSAAAGFVRWTKPLERVAGATRALSVRLLGLDKRTNTVTLHFEAGRHSAASATDYARLHYKLDPRLALIASIPVGKWLACQDHFDDAYVARDPFFQSYLLPHGSRYLYAVKLLEDESSLVILCHHRPPGDPLVDPRERSTVERLGKHIGKGLRIARHLAGSAVPDSLGFELLDRLRSPAILIDARRHITFRNKLGRVFLEQGDFVFDRHGVLACQNPESEVEFSVALRELGVTPLGISPGSPQAAERSAVRLRRRTGMQFAIGMLLALRPKDAIDVFGRTPRVLVTVHDLDTDDDLELQPLAATFALTVAEARIASMLVCGRTLDEIAAELRVSIATVRSHLHAIFEKTHTGRQVDLVRLFLAVRAL